MDHPLFSFAVIADTHMLPEQGDDSSPWQVNKNANGRARHVVSLLNDLAPEFIIHLGDIVHPVPVLPTYGDACDAAKEAFAALNCPIHTIPGNHDVGDKPNPQMPAGGVSDPNIDAYESYFGSPHSSFDHGDCHFTLINAQVINSGLDRESAQARWLEQDLADNQGKRLFLFTHYPPFVMDADEASHYDNLDEPGRAWLLGLIAKHSVEAVFCGHVHGFFYNRMGRAESYILPATSFFRQDYAELFRIEAADEFGRNDADKLGFFMVHVHGDKHVARLQRTNGEVLDAGAAPPARKPKLPTYHTKDTPRAQAGVHLRHPWNEVTDLPYNGPMEEFSRKRVRNDYALLALWELGIRKVRVPAAELLDGATRERIAQMRDIGHEFTFFTFDAPGGETLAALTRHRDLVDAIEVIIPWADCRTVLPKLTAFRENTGLPVYLTKLETSADKKTAGSKFSHFVSYGFRSTEISDVDHCLEMPAGRDAVDGFIFRVGLDLSPFDEIRRISQLASERNTRAVVNIRLASENPAHYNQDDRLIAAQVAESLVAAFAFENITLFIDTFIDLDRGYFPRHGLFDRRYNPRPASFVFQNLHSFLAAQGNQTTLVERLENGAGAVCLFETPEGRAALLLPTADGGGAGLLELAGTAGADAKWIDLESGEVTEFTAAAADGGGPALLTF